MGLFGRHLRLLFLVTALVVAAFSTGIEFLFFLVYLTVAIGIGSWLYARRGLKNVRADYRVINPRTHVGEVLQALYRIASGSRGSSAGTSRRCRPASPAASSAFRRAARVSGSPR
jgi:hypothetical protein